MKVLEVLLPVLAMILLGMLCRKKNFLKRSSIDGLKFLTTKIILPVAIFHALGTAAYSGNAVRVVGIMFGMLVVSFGIGFLLKGFVKEPYKKYVPFMVSVYEGGMMAYPLFTNLCGAENLSQIALLDIAGQNHRRSSTHILSAFVKSVSVSALSAPPREGFHLGPLWGRSPTVCA